MSRTTITAHTTPKPVVGFQMTVRVNGSVMFFGADSARNRTTVRMQLSHYGLSKSEVTSLLNTARVCGRARTAR